MAGRDAPAVPLAAAPAVLRPAAASTAAGRHTTAGRRLFHVPGLSSVAGAPASMGAQRLPPMATQQLPPMATQQLPPMAAAPAIQVVSTTAPPNPRRPMNLPTTGLPRTARKKPGPKKKMAGSSALASAALAPLPAAPFAPTSTSIAGHGSGIDEEDHDACSVFDEMTASAQSFSSMMDDSVPIDNFSLGHSFPMLDDEVTETTSFTKKRGQRAANYSTDEDVALIMAWESVSLDAVVGVDQNSSTYWSRIAEHFHRNVKEPSKRTIGSLQHRWSTIQDCCSKWAACTSQIERQHPSGVPIQELINYTQELYKLKDREKHRPFTMLHCWALLQHNEKWINRDNECPPKKPRSSNSCSREFGAYEEGNEGDEEGRRSPTSSNRPPGRKQEKEKLRKQDHGGYKEAIHEMIEAKKKLAVEKDERWMDIKLIEERKVAAEERKIAVEERKAAAEERKVAAEEERLRMKALAKKNEQDQKIMFMDTTNLDDTQKAYVEAMRNQILTEMLGARESRSGGI